MRFIMRIDECIKVVKAEIIGMYQKFRRDILMAKNNTNSTNKNAFSSYADEQNRNSKKNATSQNKNSNKNASRNSSNSSDKNAFDESNNY